MMLNVVIAGGALGAKQSRIRGMDLDCFGAKRRLAMTTCWQNPPRLL
jgi:hypothetical protein